jgi:hypothetical protein
MPLGVMTRDVVDTRRADVIAEAQPASAETCSTERGYSSSALVKEPDRSFLDAGHVNNVSGNHI